ncbi:MAG: phage holin family protein [Candidatus Binatia bacterium]
MFIVLINWLVSGLSLMLVAAVIPGFEVVNFGTALIAALVIGLVNATLGFLLKILTFPLTILTFGLFLFVINALMLALVAHFVPGFVISSFFSAFFGALALALVSMALRVMIFTEDV